MNMTELMRVVAESLANEAVDARADEACEGGSRRNGHRVRKLVTGVGTINLGIPKLRAGGYFPEDLIERYSRAGRAVVAAVSEMVADGASAGKVKRVARTMGIDRMGASQVPRICSSPDESVADLRERDPSDVTYPYIRLDATYIKCGDAGRVRSTAPVAAIGAGSGGCRRLPGPDAIGTESHGGWRSFPLSLRARGVDGAIRVTGDARGAPSARSGRPSRAPRGSAAPRIRCATPPATRRPGRKRAPCRASRRPCSPSATPSSRGSPANSPPPG